MVRPCCMLLVFAHHVAAWVSQTGFARAHFRSHAGRTQLMRVIAHCVNGFAVPPRAASMMTGRNVGQLKTSNGPASLHSPVLPSHQRILGAPSVQAA